MRNKLIYCIPLALSITCLIGCAAKATQMPAKPEPVALLPEQKQSATATNDAKNETIPTPQQSEHEDTPVLQIEDGKDYVTLVTCTPFGINTHRLLVRGHRVPYTPEQEVAAAGEKTAASSWTQHYLTGLSIGLGVVVVAGGAYFLVRRKRHA